MLHHTGRPRFLVSATGESEHLDREEGEVRISEADGLAPTAPDPVLPEMADIDSGHPAISRALLMLASTGFSVLLHGSVLAAAFLLIDDTPGAIAPPTEAISLELFQTEVMETVAIAPSKEAAASLASVDQTPGEALESLSASQSAEPVATEPVAAAAEGLEVLQGAVESEEAVGQERAEPKRVERMPEKPAIKRAKRSAKPVKTAKLTDPSEQPRDADSAPRKKGAAAARAAKGSAASSGRVSASTGSAVNYAAQVRARVASRKPAGGGKRGTVVVAFGVTRSGGLSYASIARSSGNPGLDSTVLSAVRSAAPFPTPPPGAQLRFAVPFHFR
jgi:protein TonB